MLNNFLNKKKSEEQDTTANKKDNNQSKKNVSSDNSTTEHTSSRSVRLIGDESNFAIREAYKTCRTNLMFAVKQEECSIFLITSSWPMEGKTTNCANLAVTFAQTGSKTLLLDCDLRKPRTDKIFRIKSKLGLTNVLRKFVSFDEAVNHTKYDNLDVLSSGHIPPNPAELLGSDEMRDLFESLKKKYKYILIDTPPVNMVSDALVLAPLTSGTVLVVRQGITDHKSITEALEKIGFSGSKVLGFILNDAADNQGNYYNKKRKYSNYKYNYYGNSYYSNSYYGYSSKQARPEAEKK